MPILVTAPNLEQAWFHALCEVVRNGEAFDSLFMGPSLEVRPAALVVSDPRQRFILSRAYNLAFGYAEFLWVMRGEHALKLVQFFNPRMKRYSDDGRVLNGAYGRRLRAAHGFDQLRAAFDALSGEPRSPQVVLQIWSPTLDFPRSGPASKDVACSLLDFLLVRQGRLEWTHVMRCNDLIWGLPYDALVFSCMQEVVAGWLGLDVGPYAHQVGTMQVFEQHFEHARELVASPSKVEEGTSADDLRLPYGEFEEVLNQLWAQVDQMIDATDPKAVLALWPTVQLPPAYQNMAAVLVSEILYRKGATKDVVAEVLDHSSNVLQKRVVTRWLGQRFQPDRDA